MDRPIDLRRVAEWTGTSVDEIQSLNPELRRWTTPLKHPGVRVEGTERDGADVPRPTLGNQRRRARLPEVAHREARRDHHEYRSQGSWRGDRLEIAEANNLSVRSRLRTGQELLIPRPPATVLAARSERTAPPVVASRPVSGTATVPDAVRASTPSSTTYYRVKRGDTLFGIAQLFNTTVEKIKSWNRLRGNTISAATRVAHPAVELPTPQLPTPKVLGRRTG